MTNRRLVYTVLALVLLLGTLLLALHIVGQSDDPRTQDGVWIVAPKVWEVVGQTILLDDDGHTLAGTYYRVTLDGTLYITCAVGRIGDGRMRLDVRENIGAGDCP